MENMEDNVKKYIISLLTSTPLTVTMTQLSKDYQNTIGECIPYHKLGYNSLEHFLKSIPDTVSVKGSGPTAAVLPVISEKIAHVNKLVTSQKVTVPKKKHAFNSSQLRKHRPQNFSKSLQSPESIPQRKIFYPATENCSSSSTVKKFTVPNKSVTPPKNQPDLPSLVNKLELSKVSNDSGNVDKHLQLIDSHKPRKNHAVSEDHKVSRYNGKTRRSVIDKNFEEIDNRVPLSIKNNLKTLIASYPNGIWCADLPDIYKKMFKKDLKYEGMGFNCLSQLCVSLPSIFHYSRPSTGDFRLYDKSTPLPPNVEQSFTLASYSNSNNKHGIEGINVTALPTIDWVDIMHFLPPDTFKPGEEIPRIFIPHDIKDSENLDIVVGEVYDISKFWVYINDGKLNNMMDEIQIFYGNHSSEYLMPEVLIREGIYCVQVIFGEYHRAFIVDVLPDVKGMIRVLFIDYGTMTKISVKGLCFLHRDFAKLPAQAIRCRLANICPVEEGMPWSQEASKAFRLMVQRRDLIAKIAKVNWEDQFLEVFLADVTNANNVFYINDRLVQDGYAQYPHKELKRSLVKSLTRPIVKYVHLFPTFLELEHGLAPSTTEMEMLVECNVPINFCYPQYFFTDSRTELENVAHIEEFFNSCLKGKRIKCNHYIDLAKLTKRDMDTSVFKDLESDIIDFMTRKECTTEKTLNIDHENGDNLLNIYTNLGLEATTKLRKDCQISEDIVRDLSILNCGDSVDFNPPVCDISMNTDTYRDFEFDILQSHPLNNMSFEQNNLYGASEKEYFEDSADSNQCLVKNESDYNKKETLSSVDFHDESKDISCFENVCDDFSSENEKCVTYMQEKNTSDSNSCFEISGLRFNSNNPFLEYIKNQSTESDTKLEKLRLSPNNPFISDDNIEKNSSQHSDASSGSTVYSTYMEEVAILQKSSTEDNTDAGSGFESSISEKMPEEIKEDSASTQTDEYKPQRFVYNYPMEAAYAYQNWSLGYDPRFPMGMFPMPDYASLCGAALMYRYGFAALAPPVFSQRPPQPQVRSICPPPPGFEVQRTVGRFNLNIPNNQNVNAPCEPTSIRKDFYEVYNKTLKGIDSG